MGSPVVHLVHRPLIRRPVVLLLLERESLMMQRKTSPRLMIPWKSIANELVSRGLVLFHPPYQNWVRPGQDCRSSTKNKAKSRILFIESTLKQLLSLVSRFSCWQLLPSKLLRSSRHLPYDIGESTIESKETMMECWYICLSMVYSPFLPVCWEGYRQFWCGCFVLCEVRGDFMIQ